MRYIIPFCLILLSSCLTDINLDGIALKRLVVEAKVPLGQTAWVKLTETTSKTGPNQFPLVENASVRIRSDQGDTEALTYVGDGVYQTENLRGALGNRYFMEIEVDDLNINGNSQMPEEIIPIDSIWYDEQYDSENTFQGTFITARFVTPPGELTQGLLKFYYGDEVLESGFLVNNADQINEVTVQVSRIFATGEEIQVEFELLEPEVFEYLEEIYQRSNSTISNIAPVAPPDNPVANLEGEVLGYFSAVAVSRKTLVIP